MIIGDKFSVLLTILALGLHRVHADLLVIFLEGCHVLPGLGELSLLHALSNIPVNKGSLGVHEVKLVVKPGPGLGDGGGVGEHTDGSLDLGLVTSRDDGWWLVVDSDLEASWTPVYKLDASLGLDGGNGSIDILGDHVSSVEKAAGHVLAMSWVTLDHLVGWLKAGVGNFSNCELLMVGFLGGDDWSISDQREVDSWIWHQVSLELSQVNIESSIKSKRGSDGGHNLTNQSVEVRVRWPLNIEVSTADVVDGLVVDHEGAIGVFQGGVGGQDRVVGLDHGGGHLGSGVDGELELGFLSVINRKTLHQKCRKSRSSSTTKGMEEKESLKSSTLISQLTDTVQDKVYNLLANGVVTSGVVVGGVLLAIDQLLRMIKLAVGSDTGLVDDGGFEVNKDSSWDVLSTSSFREEGLEGVISKSLVRWHTSIRLDTVLQTVELPASVSNLDSSLANVNRDTLTHDDQL